MSIGYYQNEDKCFMRIRTEIGELKINSEKLTTQIPLWISRLSTRYNIKDGGVIKVRTGQYGNQFINNKHTLIVDLEIDPTEEQKQIMDYVPYVKPRFNNYREAIDSLNKRYKDLINYLSKKK